MTGVSASMMQSMSFTWMKLSPSVRGMFRLICAITRSAHSAAGLV